MMSKESSEWSMKVNTYETEKRNPFWIMIC
jgi:hypothetical protein